jgi:hypothetical protein
MTEQIQKKKYVIKRVLSEEDVSKIKEELTKVLQNAMQYYRNLIGYSYVCHIGQKAITQ